MCLVLPLEEKLPLPLTSVEQLWVLVPFNPPVCLKGRLSPDHQGRPPIQCKLSKAKDAHGLSAGQGGLW